MLSSLLTIVGGGTTAVVSTGGLIAADDVTGVHRGDRRLLSLLDWHITGHERELLASRRMAADRHVAHWVIRDADGHRRALLTTTLRVAGSVDIELIVRRFDERATVELAVDVATDLADLLQLRYGATPPNAVLYAVADERLVAGDDRLGVSIAAPGAVIDGGGRLTWTVAAGAAGAHPVRLRVCPRPRPTTQGTARRRLRVSGSHGWTRAIDSGLADLQALRMHDAARRLSWIAAGAPWYLALFGRDALLTAYEALPAGPELALDVLDALAHFQGAGDDPRTGEAPGKILHELRTGHSGVFGLAPWTPYYGSVDATPLFVVVLAAAHRWGAAVDRVRSLLPAARGAVSWCRATAGDDRHGWLTYRSDGSGLRNQGWKDHADAMVHADGTLAHGPIAVVEAQAYHWRALIDLAALETAIGEPTRAAQLRADADDLRRRLLDEFASDAGCVFAMALDGDGRRLEVASSNAGHLLWTQLLDPADADRLAGRLLAADMHAGWGVRTLSATAVAYDPLSYHRGSIWPHDTALLVDGLARTRQRAAVVSLVDGVLAVAEHDRWRLPELIAGYGTDTVDAPVPYPVACSPQAWSAAVPLQLLRTVLRLEPDVPAGRVAIGPCLDPDLTLDVVGIGLGAHRLDVSVDRGRITAAVDPPLRITIER